MKNHTCTCRSSCACPDCPCASRAGLFGTLGNPGRLAILTALRAAPQSVTELSRRTGLEQTAVSHALHRLSSAKLVRAHRRGKQRIYAIDAIGTRELARGLGECVFGTKNGRTQR